MRKLCAVVELCMHDSSSCKYTHSEMCWLSWPRNTLYTCLDICKEHLKNKLTSCEYCTSISSVASKSSNLVVLF